MSESGWLIEEITGGTRWYSGTGVVDADDPQEGWSGVVWTKDASKAIRFCRKVDAEMAMRTLGFDDPKHFAATEHVWVDPLTHPQDAGGDAAPVLFGRDSGGDWYVDTDTKSICVDVDFDPARQLSLVLKQDGSVAWSIFVQEPDSSTTKATGPSVMNPGFYEALSYIAMQAKEAKS